MEKNISNIQKEPEIEKKIKDAFIKLYEDRPIEKISIKMITDLAGLNRGTFYIHYVDIYDLREHLEKEFFDLIKGKVQAALVELFQNRDFASVLPDMDFYKRHRKYLEVLLCSYGKSQLGELMKNEVKESISSMTKQNGGQDNMYTEYALEYFTSAMLGVLILWIKQGIKLPINSLGEFLVDISKFGSVPYLLRSLGIENFN